MQMEQLELRDRTVEDQEAIDAIRRLAWLDSYVSEDSGVSEELINDYFAYRKKQTNQDERLARLKLDIVKPQKYNKVAVNGIGQVVGFINGMKKTKDKAILEALYLEPSYIGKGNGRLLMDGFMEWLGEGAGCELFVVEYNNRAIKFYEKYGFMIVSDEPVQESKLDASHPLVDKMPVIRMVNNSAMNKDIR